MWKLDAVLWVTVLDSHFEDGETGRHGDETHLGHIRADMGTIPRSQLKAQYSLNAQKSIDDKMFATQQKNQRKNLRAY